MKGIFVCMIGLKGLSSVGPNFIRHPAFSLKDLLVLLNFLNAIGHSGKVGVPHHFRVIIQGEFSVR